MSYDLFSSPICENIDEAAPSAPSINNYEEAQPPPIAEFTGTRYFIQRKTDEKTKNTLIFKLLALLSLVSLSMFIALFVLYSQSQTGWSAETVELKAEFKRLAQNSNIQSNIAKPQTKQKMEANTPCSMGLKFEFNKNITPSESMMWDGQSKSVYQQISSVSFGSSCEKWWLEVKFKSSRTVAGIVTQGNPANDSWVTTYNVSCGDDDGLFEDYTENGMKKIFQGNSNANSTAFNIFANPLSCRSIRITPNSWQSNRDFQVELLHEGCYAPAEYRIFVKSQGLDDGFFCKILVDGVTKSIQGRGFCVVVFNPFNATIRAATFDTYGPDVRPAETVRMASYLRNVEDNAVVAISVGDSAGPPIGPTITAHMKELGAVGVSCDLNKYGFRDSFAFIGQKLPLGAERPDWIKCQHSTRYHGHAAVHATIKTSKFFIED